MAGAKLIGLISDTHGRLRPAAVAALRGSDLIIHAGDIGKLEIIDQLRAVAPVVAVRGNVDNDPWASQFPLTKIVEAGGVRIYVIHDVKQIGAAPPAGVDIVVSGHSHQPGSSERRGILYVNPGSAGPRRFRLPVTVARLNVASRPWGIEFVDVSATISPDP